MLLPALLVHGVLLSFLFAPLHECIHRTAFTRRSANAACAWLCGLPLWLPPRYFRYFHLAHHRHTQDPVRDPELSVGRPADVRQWLWHVSGLPYWRERIVTTLRHAAGRVDEAFVPTGERAAVTREARVMLGVFAAGVSVSALAGGNWWLWLWVVPALLGQPVLRLFLLAEHWRCPLVPDMLANTRTTVSVAPVRWLCWNMNYHAEHHLRPAVPFHRLPELHGRLSGRHGCHARGYVSMHCAGLRAMTRG